MPTASFGNWVREARTALDLTQEALAERTGCAVQTIRKIEAGERRPSRQMAQRLAYALALPDGEHAWFLKAARADANQPAGAPAATAPARPPRLSPALPAMHTVFIGRQAELAEVRRLLADPERRLVTLAGPGGIGKTRLALEAVTAGRPFADGVIFVPLAPISTAALLVPTIAHAIGFTFSGPLPPADQILQHLATRDMLLILDNLEHLLDETPGEVPTDPGIFPGSAADLLARIVAEAPGVKLLVTSRERVSLRGEWAVQLAGLPVGQADAPDDTRDADAVVLFAERARQVQHDFQLNAANREVVARICRLLEGVPLGIELAATWTRVLSPMGIVAELERGLDFLQTTTRDLPERHRSMRAVFEHSWRLLEAEEKQVLRRLAVFRGGFTRVAAAHVAGATLGVLAALVDKSLMRRAGAERYDLHEVVRQYAAGHLELDVHEHAAARDSHCTYFVAWLADRDRLLKSTCQRETVAEIATEIDNLRAAWDWAAREKRPADLRRAIPTLFYFYEIRSAYQEGAALFEHAADALDRALPGLAVADDVSGADERLLVGELLAMQAWFLFRYGQYGRAQALLERSFALLEARHSTGSLSEALPYPPWLLRYRLGDYSRGVQLLRERVQVQRERGDTWGVAFSLMHLGLLLRFQGDDQEAYHRMREAVLLSKSTGDPVAMGRILSFAAVAANAAGAYDEAHELACESLAISRRMDDRFSSATALHALGRVAHAREEYVEARARLEESLAAFTALGYRWNRAHVLSDLGQTLHAMGATAEARRTLIEALAVTTESRTIRDALDAAVELAALARAQGEIEQALEIALQVPRHPAGSRAAKDRAEQLRLDLEAALAPGQVAEVRSRVAARTFDEAMEDLLARWRSEDQRPGGSGPGSA